MNMTAHFSSNPVLNNNDLLTGECSPNGFSPENLGLKSEWKEEHEALLTFLRQLKSVASNSLLGIIQQLNVKPFKVDYVVKEMGKLLKQDFDRFQIRCVILGRMIDMGNEKNYWNICPIIIPVRIPELKNPLSQNTPEQLKQFKHWKEHAEKSLKRSLSYRLELGRILFFSACYGGLLNHRALQTLLKQVQQPLLIYLNRVTVPLQLQDKQGEPEYYRRWQPDILTTLLLMNLRKPADESINTRKGMVIALIKEFLVDSGISNDDIPSNISEFIQLASIEFDLRLPPFLVGYAKHRHISHSLRDETFYRHLSPSTSNKEASMNTSFKKLEFEEDSDFIEPSGEIDEIWIADLRKCLKHSSKQDARNHLKQHFTKFNSSSEDILPIRKYITLWLLELVKHGSAFGHSLQISTIQNYLSLLVYRLLAAFDCLDPTLMSEEDLSDAYLQVLESAQSMNHHKKLASLLSQFHDYLSKCHPVAEISSNGIFALKSRLSQVNANLINMDEYKDLLTWLKTCQLEHFHKDAPSAAQLIVILAFRCGLRRNEVLKLRLIDIQGFSDPTLLVRPHAGRRLKTFHSQRQIPLNWFLTEEELKLLQSWIDMRKSQESSCKFSDYLFSIPEKKVTVFHEKFIIPVIHEGMRLITGDESSRFHEFRHSFVSWNLLSLMLDSMGEVPGTFFGHLPETTIWLKGGGNRRFKIYGHNNPTKKDLYLVSSTLGHSSPAITLEHYFHFCDLLLATAIYKKFPAPETNLLRYASRLKRSSALRHIKIDSNAHQGQTPRYQKLLTAVIEANPNKVTKLSFKSIKPSSNPSQVSGSTDHYPLLIYNIYNMLLLANSRDTDITDFAERFGFTTEQAKSIQKAALRYQRFKGDSAKKSPRARLESITSWKLTTSPGQPNKLFQAHIELPVPKKPVDFDDAQQLIQSSMPLLFDCDKELNWLLGYFTTHARQNDNALIFKRPNEARRFISLLGRLGIPQNKISYCLHYGIKQKPKLLKSYWKNALDIRTTFYDRLQKGNSMIGPHGNIGIGIEFNSKSHASDAVRYVLAMLWIYNEGVLKKAPNFLKSAA